MSPDVSVSVTGGRRRLTSATLANSPRLTRGAYLSSLSLARFQIPGLVVESPSPIGWDFSVPGPGAIHDPERSPCLAGACLAWSSDPKPVLPDFRLSPCATLLCQKGMNGIRSSRLVLERRSEEEE